MNNLLKLSESESQATIYETEKPRYLQPKPDSWVFLGFYDNYDLYYGSQNGTEPNVMARYGNKETEYEQGLSSEMSKPLLEAMVRAVKYLTFLKL